ncbi:MAG: enoyl-CoA hydratase, partial [Nocardioides sp.]|nr:enoyl-CoA hydratase [Nocardioides sp.]
MAPSRLIGVDRRPNNEAETGVGLGAPIYMYALMESAVRGRLGRAPGEHRTAIARLWSRLSGVAAANPFAWSPQAVDADVIATAAPDNRAVSEPYTKLMCANLQVDLAAGVIVTSVAAAEAAGVPQDRWVFLHAGASAHDEWFVSERADLSRSPAIAALGEAALEHAGVGIDDVAHVDLYACFPSAVEIGADALGLPVDDESRPLTVTGGLTFAGGPGNNYGTHALASLVPVLRADPDSRGLCTSLGWYATKHALGIYSATPPARSYEHLRPVVAHPPRRPVGTSYDGAAVVEAYTVPFDRDGSPEAGVLSLLTPEGTRVLVRTTDPAVIATLVDGDALGCDVVVAGEQVTLTGNGGSALPAPPRPPVRTERHGAVSVITLDRPEVRNAIDARTAEELERAVDAAEADPRVRA